MERRKRASAISVSPRRPQESIVRLLGPYWSKEHIQTLPGTAALAVAAGRALALPTSDAAWIYPVWQFARTPDGEVVLKRGVTQTLYRLRSADPWLVGLLLIRPHADLGGQRPLDWLASGGDPSDTRLRWLSDTTSRQP